MRKENTVPETQEEIEQELEPEETVEQETAPVDETAQKLTQAETALAELQDQYARVLAEYANYKRRTEQEKETIGVFAKADILSRLIPMIDDLDRAAAAPDGPNYRKGIDMIIDKLHGELGKLGLTEIPALGEPFDPEVHHAVMREDADGVEPDTVTEVFQKGYRYGDRIIRAAMVKVAN